MNGEYGLVSGKVQGVGFRNFVQASAQRLGVTGWAHNLADGRVEVLLCGSPELVAQVKQQVAIGPDRGRVDSLEWSVKSHECPVGFTTG